VKNTIKNIKLKTPLLRLDLDFNPEKSNPNSKVKKIDITVFDRNHNGPIIAHYIN
jgi:hypothetical protein